MTTISEIIEANEYEDLKYDDDGPTACQKGSCYHCDTEPVTLLVVTDHPNFGSSFTRMVCVRCGNLVS